MQRRTWLKLGVASAAVLVVGGGALSLLEPAWVGGHLSPAAREVFRATGRAVLDGTLPPAGAAREAALAGLLDRVDALVAALPPHGQAELSQLLALLASTPGRRAFAGLPKPWPEASDREVQQALDSMRHSSLELRQQAYHALHDIVSGAYFTDEATWAHLGYPGPKAV